MGITIVSFPGYKGFLHGFKFSSFFVMEATFFLACLNLCHKGTKF